MNDQDAISLIDRPNPDAEDIQYNSYYSQSSTNVNVGLPSLIISNNQKFPFLSEIDDEIQAEITETKIVLPKNVGQWPYSLSEQPRKQFLIE